MFLGSILALIIFLVGYLLITIEHRVGTHKSAISLALAGILWTIVAFSVSDREMLTHASAEAGSEVFSIIAFLLAAMSLVEILVHYGFFDLIRSKLSALKFNDQKQFVVLAGVTFFLSAIIDNLTTTIVMIQIARKFYKDTNLLVVVSGIVIISNAGGAWSPIGDVTTIMLWVAQKFDAFTIITQGILPSLALAAAVTALLMKQIKNTSFEVKTELKTRLSKGERLIISLTLLSFAFPIAMNLIGLPPYLGLLFGLGVVWFMIEFIKTKSHRVTHLEANIDRLLQRTDISSINFFIGILLSVSALHTIGILDQASHLILGQDPTFERLVTGNILLGLLSAVVDNVPLTAIAINSLMIDDPQMWVLTALTVGTGGSALLIGSVAGVIAMGMVKSLTFDKYLKIATIPALVGYFAAISVWVIQYQLSALL